MSLDLKALLDLHKQLKDLGLGEKEIRNRISEAAADAPVRIQPEPIDLTELDDDLVLLKVSSHSTEAHRLIVQSLSVTFKNETTILNGFNPGIFNVDKKSDYQAGLICMRDADGISVIGAFVFDTFQRFGQWTLLWLWIHPLYRSKDIVKKLWAMFEVNHPNFQCLLPFSEAMIRTAFTHDLRLKEYEEPDTVIKPKTFALEDERLCEIREASAKDLPLLEKAFLMKTTEGYEHARTLLNTRDRKQSMRLIVALIDNRVVGTAWIDFSHAISGDLAAVIDDFDIHRDFRGVGICEEFFGYAEKMIVEADLSTSEIGIDLHHLALGGLLRAGYSPKIVRRDLSVEFRLGDQEFTWTRYIKSLILVKDLTKNADLIDSTEAEKLAEDVRQEYQHENETEPNF